MIYEFWFRLMLILKQQQKTVCVVTPRSPRPLRSRGQKGNRSLCMFSAIKPDSYHIKSVNRLHWANLEHHQTKHRAFQVWSKASALTPSSLTKKKKKSQEPLKELRYLTWFNNCILNGLCHLFFSKGEGVVTQLKQGLNMLWKLYLTDLGRTGKTAAAESVYYTACTIRMQNPPKQACALAFSFHLSAVLPSTCPAEAGCVVTSSPWGDYAQPNKYIRVTLPLIYHCYRLRLVFAKINVSLVKGRIHPSSVRGKRKVEGRVRERLLLLSSGSECFPAVPVWGEWGSFHLQLQYQPAQLHPRQTWAAQQGPKI